MKTKRKIKDVSSLVLTFAGVVLMVIAFGPFSLSNNPEVVARRVSAAVEHRVVKLESFMAMAMEEDHSGWLELDGLPDDMVIYLYCSDTLLSVCNEFPIYNENRQ